ncbi:hypothetical protein RKD19_000097 [Streptomyces canus]
MSLSTLATCSMPSKKWNVYVKVFFGVPPRPKNQACQGSVVETQGTPSLSHLAATGWIVSGVAVTRTRSTCCWEISSSAMVAACWGSEPVSRSRIFTS